MKQRSKSTQERTLLQSGLSKCRAAAALALGVGALAVLPAIAQGQSATRSVSPSTYQAGQSVTVTIEVSNAGNSSAWTLRDTFPEGWEVDENSLEGPGGGSVTDEDVRWTGGGFVQIDNETFSYQATAPTDAEGTAQFGDGNLSIAGEDFEVAGVSSIDEGDGGGDPDPDPDDDPPTITAHPEDQTVEVGGSVTFTVSANNATGFQWQRNGSNISGATDSSLTINNVSEEDAGNYRVRVSNEHGTTVSDVASLSIDVPDLVPVAIDDLTVGQGDELLSGSRIYNLAGNYEVEGDDDVSFTIVHNNRGRLSGTGEIDGDEAQLHGTIRRLGTSASPLHRVNVSLRVPETGEIRDYTLDLDAGNAELAGESRLRGSAEADSISMPLPSGRDGTWSLNLDTDNQGEGEATLDLDGDEEITYDVTARRATAHDNRTILTLEPTESNGGGTIRIDLDSDDEVVLVMGRAKGQTLNAR